MVPIISKDFKCSEANVRIFRPMFEFLGRALQARLDTLADRIRPGSHTLETLL